MRTRKTSKEWLQREERVWDINALVALSPLVIAAILLLISLASELSYGDLCREHPQYASTLTLMDVIDKVTARLNLARRDLTDYVVEGRYGPDHHWANSTHAAVNVKRAREALEKMLHEEPDLREAHRLLGELHQQLRKAEVVQGERWYRDRFGPLFDHAQGVLETYVGPRTDLVPKAILVRRKLLQKWSRIPFWWGIGVGFVGVSFGVLWISDLKERMQQQRFREVLRARREEAGNLPPENLV